jgi:hypothetical protein
MFAPSVCLLIATHPQTGRESNPMASDAHRCCHTAENHSPPTRLARFRHFSVHPLGSLTSWNQ